MRMTNPGRCKSRKLDGPILYSDIIRHWLYKKKRTTEVRIIKKIPSKSKSGVKA